MPSISFLVTGPEDALMDWQMDAMGLVELFDRRGQTVRCRAHAGPPFMDLDQWHKDIANGVLDTNLDRAEQLVQICLNLAQKHDVTMQKLDHENGAETYPVLWLASHGQKWPTDKKKRKNSKPKG